MRLSLVDWTWLWLPTRRTLVIIALLILAALAVWRLSAPPVNASESQPVPVLPQDATKQDRAAHSTAGEITAVTVTPVLSGAWAEQLSNAIGIYKANYPASNFDPYIKKLAQVQDALTRGDRQAVKTEMIAYFKMLDTRASGISEVASVELVNFSKMVVPLQEYGIAVPRSGANR